MKKLSLLLSALVLSACGGSGGSGNGSSAGGISPPITHVFGANNGANGQQLWKTNGTEAATVMVKMINASGNADIQVVANISGKTIFTADDGIHGQELWVTDGSEAGTLMLKDINNATASTSIQTAAIAGNTLYFAAYNSVYGVELWKTDGTASGTVLVKDIHPGSNGSVIEYMVALGSEVYFRANDGINGSQLWKSDGTAAGTLSIGASVIPMGKMFAYQGTIYFKGNDSSNSAGAELYKSDGTAAGTMMIKDIYPGPTESRIKDIVGMGGNIYFLAAESGTQGIELWKSDGTAAGTTLVKDINPEASGSLNNNSSAIRYLTATSNKLFFTARTSSSTTVRGLWVSDGSEAGTFLLHDAASVSDVIVTENATYFDGYDAVNGNELWKTDGTTAGTALLKDVAPGTDSSGFYSLGVYNYYETPTPPVLKLSNGSILMAGFTPTKGMEVWKTDGTAAGTVLVKDINPGMGDGLDN